MNLNYKNLFYIFHPDGEFTEEQLKRILDAAYEEGRKKGYNDGYEAGKGSFSITYPYKDWWNHPYYSITCNSKTVPATGIDFSNTTGKVTISTGNTIANTTNSSSITTTATTDNCKEYCGSTLTGNIKITKSESPYGMEFKYYGTEQ